jgi:hypothetical protein
MKTSIPMLLAAALCGCASQKQALRTPAERALAINTCPQPGAAAQTQAALAGEAPPPVDIPTDETAAFGPTRVIWVHPPERALNRCR